MKKGILIVMDGIDGCGKTTTIRALQTAFVNKGRVVECFKVIGEGSIGHKVRERLFHNGELSEPQHDFEALMMATSIYETIVDHVVPALAAGKVVLVDRWMSSFLAFQCFGNQSTTAIDIFTGYLLPLHYKTPIDLFVYVKTPTDVAEERIKGRSGATYLDLRDMEFKQRVEKGFDMFLPDYMASHHGDGIVVAGDGSVYESVKEILAALDNKGCLNATVS